MSDTATPLVSPPAYSIHDNSKPHDTTHQVESKMLDSASLTNMPSMFDGTVLDAPDYNHFAAFPPQTNSQSGFASWSPWSETHQPALDDRDTYSYRREQSFTSHPTEASCEGLEHHKLVKHQPWSQQTPRGPGYPSPFPMFPMNHTFLPDHEFSRLSCMQRPSLPLPTSANGQRPWDESGLSETMNDILAPQPRHTHVFAFDAAYSGGPSLYSTASNQHTPLPSTMRHMYQDTDDVLTVDSYETDNESGKAEPPYARLIYNALMEAPGKRLVLREIYAWISNNTDKAKDPAFKGWQNSVRHNLSMNGAFVKVPHTDPVNKHKKGFIWVLDPAAVGKGIESTTRYRQKAVGKRSDGSDLADLKRQKSGRRGGKAARKSAKLRRFARMDDHHSRYARYLGTQTPDYLYSSPGSDCRSVSPSLSHYNLGGLPYYLDPPSSESPHPEHSLYNYPDPTIRPTVSADQSLFNDSFDNDSDLVDSRAEDLFGGQGLPE